MSPKYIYKDSLSYKLKRYFSIVKFSMYLTGFDLNRQNQIYSVFIINLIFIYMIVIFKFSINLDLKDVIIIIIFDSLS